MIAVIADDLTGAAELAGIGITYGLNVELAMSVNTETKADLLVIATDTRSVSEPEAVQRTTHISQILQAMKPSMIYKKIDSVLRGHVIAETQIQLQILGLSKALLVPANPALGRTLVDGQYYVQNVLIHQTHFAHDPEFPINESNVLTRFREKAKQLVVLSHRSILPEKGIVIGEVENETDLIAWAKRIDVDTLLGGGSDFFSAILKTRELTQKVPAQNATLGTYRLYVCGTAFGESATLVRKAIANGHPVHYMPKSLTQATYQEDITNWVNEINDDMLRHKQVIVAIDPASVSFKKGLALHLRTMMAKATGNVLNQVMVDELIIEGGSTASAILQEIGVTSLIPTEELAPGVVRNATVGRNELHITMKPGSYHWPPDLWMF